MSAPFCFSLSPTPFFGARPLSTSSCSRVRPRRFSPRIVYATAAEADAERPQNVEVIPEVEEEPPLVPFQDDFEEEVPGKIPLTPEELAEQRVVLEQYAKELRMKRLAEEAEASRLFGFVPYAETLNGRLAMFFIVTGLLTEYWTGYSIPEQVELMARTLGII